MDHLQVRMDKDYDCDYVKFGLCAQALTLLLQKSVLFAKWC